MKANARECPICHGIVTPPSQTRGRDPDAVLALHLKIAHGQ